MMGKPKHISPPMRRKDHYYVFYNGHSWMLEDELLPLFFSMVLATGDLKGTLRKEIQILSRAPIDWARFRITNEGWRMINKLVRRYPQLVENTRVVRRIT